MTSLNTFGNTVSWINGINTGVLPNINTGYLKATTPLSQYDPYELSGMDASELGRVQSQYASIQLADGANMNAMATIGAIRGSRRQHPDSNRKSPGTRLFLRATQVFNSELVSVLNKINAAGVFDSPHRPGLPNKLLASASPNNKPSSRSLTARRCHRAP